MEAVQTVHRVCKDPPHPEEPEESPLPSVRGAEVLRMCCASVSPLELLVPPTHHRFLLPRVVEGSSAPEGRGAKLPPGPDQSCLGESDRGDLFPRAPSWRGAGQLSSPRVSSLHLLGPPLCPTGTPRVASRIGGAAGTRGSLGQWGAAGWGLAGPCPPIPLLPAPITVSTGPS